jgi:hypothetical protein
MRHDGARNDSFVPMPLRIPAVWGAKRSEEGARIAFRRAGLSQGKPATGLARPMGRSDARGLPLSIGGRQ